MTSTDEQTFLTIDEVAAFIRTTKPTLYDWSYNHEGPPVYKIGRKLLYKRDEVMAWVESKRRS